MIDGKGVIRMGLLRSLKIADCRVVVGVVEVLEAFAGGRVVGTHFQHYFGPQLPRRLRVYRRDCAGENRKKQNTGADPSNLQHRPISHSAARPTTVYLTFFTLLQHLNHSPFTTIVAAL